MKLANYINDLLYRYDCVIVPNFGGFITNKISAVLDETSHAFYPPTKQIGFNVNLKHNDGLLANYIASSENISFQEANTIIDKEVFIWLTDLEKQTLEIDAVGQMFFNDEKQVVFEPNTTTNFLTDSFGLSSVEVHVKETFTEKVIPITSTEEINSEDSDKKVIPLFVKNVAAAAVLLTLGLVGYQQYNSTLEKEVLIIQQQKIQEKIQKATFVIDNPLPTINLSVTKINNKNKKFHVIAGAFQLIDNAIKKVDELKREGYNAIVLGKNKWGLTQVAFDSFDTKSEARSVLNSVKNKGFDDAWLLVKKVD